MYGGGSEGYDNHGDNRPKDHSNHDDSRPRGCDSHNRSRGCNNHNRSERHQSDFSASTNSYQSGFFTF